MSIFTNPPRFSPERIKRPSQLTAALITGIVLINITLLTVAASLGDSPRTRLVIIAGDMLITLTGLGGAFRLQSRYRPEMQDDEHYFRYMERKIAYEFEVRKREIEAEVQLERIRAHRSMPVGGEEKQEGKEADEAPPSGTSGGGDAGS